MSAEPSTISFLRRRGLLAAFFALAACDGDTTPIVKDSAESLQLAPTNAPGAGLRQGVAATAGATVGKDADYKLGANDRLRITVFGQPTLTGEYTLDGNGVLCVSPDRQRPRQRRDDKPAAAGDRRQAPRRITS